MRTKPFPIMLALFFSVILSTPSLAQKIRFASDWLITGNDAPYFLAIERGLYEQRGLEVIYSRGYGGADGVKRLAAGERDMVIVNPAPVVIARSKGNNIKLVGVIFEKDPISVFSLKKTGIKTIKDLEGRSVALAPFGVESVLFPILLKVNNVALDRVKLIKVAPAQKISMLIGGKVDAISQFMLLKDIIDAKAAPLGGADMKLFADYGLDLYSNSWAVTDAYAAKNGTTIRKFLAVTLKALDHTRKNPDEAVRALLRHNPAISPKSARAVWDRAASVIFTPAAEKTGLGYMDPEKMKRTLHIIVRAYNIKNPPRLEDVYTNQFLK